MPSPRCIRLVVPGLLGPVSDPDTVARIAPPLPALAHCLARSRVHHGAVADGEGAVCSAFGLDGPPWPVAAAARHGEAQPPPTAQPGWWLRADPVHLRVDSNHARLFGPYVLGLDSGETASLVARLNQHIGADGLHIEAPVPERWYLALAGPTELTTYPLPVVAGRNVNPFMPTGAASGHWRGWLTELQMLLHDAPANLERERAGHLPANSVWLWGEGAVPNPPTAPRQVLSDEPLARGLARLAGVEGTDRPECPDAAKWPEGSTLVVDPGPRDPLIHGEVEAWLEVLARIDADWIGPLLERLATGDFDRLEIEPGDGRRFELTRAGRYRVWRRTWNWHRWLSTE